MADWNLDLCCSYWAAFFATSACAFEHLYEVPSLRASHRCACFRGWSGGPAFQSGPDVQPRKGATHFEPGYLILPEALAVSAFGGAKPSSLGGAAPRCTASAPWASSSFVSSTQAERCHRDNGPTNETNSEAHWNGPSNLCRRMRQTHWRSDSLVE